MLRQNNLHEDLTERIIACGINVHTEFGAGLLESIYGACFVIELRAAGLSVEEGRRVPLFYKGEQLPVTLSVDLIVENTVLIEIKAVEAIAPVHQAQVVTYLKLTGLPVGLLINFNVPVLRGGIRRLVRPDLYVPPGRSITPAGQ